MTDDEVREAIEALRMFRTDVSDIEAKRAQSALPKSVRETLSSFSNTAGGVIILGLDEASGFRVTGVHDPRRVADSLAATCSDEMDPPLRPLIRLHHIDDKSLVVAEIPELDAAQKPCYYRGAGMNRGSYVRVGDSDRRLTPYEVQIMLASRGQPREDEQPVAGATVADLDEEMVERLASRLRRTRPGAFADVDTRTILERLRVVVQGAEGEPVPSLGGLLALGRYPQQFAPQLNVTFVVYPTETGEPLATGERFLDNVTVEGAIPSMVRDALTAVRRNMKRVGVVTGAGRTDRWEYPDAALREAVVNALVHRDLSPASHGTQVQIEMYPDRLVVRNPGGLYRPVRVDDLGTEGVSSSRNATLLKILEDVELPEESGTVVENRGSGIRTMIYALRAAGMSPPEFRDRVATFEVVIPNHALMSDGTVEWLTSLGEPTLTDSQVLALALAHEGAVLDNATYRTATGVDSRVATTELQDLVGRELLQQVGERRWTKYMIAHRARDADDQRPSRADRRDEILSVLGDESLSRAELAERTGLTDPTVRRWLKILRSEGAIELTTPTHSRNATYRRIR